MSTMIDFKKEAIGSVIRKIRIERKLSQDVVSGLAGIARTHLAMIETGRKQPNFETIWNIANAFEMPPHKLVELIELEAIRMESEKNFE